MKKLLACACVLFVAAGIVAADEPFQASLTPDIAIYSQSEPITGLTLSIWGENPQHSLAIGFVNGTSGESGGLDIGLVNYGDSFKGVQWAIVNYQTGNFMGWQDGAVNYTMGRVTGFQSGWVNYAGTLSGLQLGLLNIAAMTDEGVQIGLVNIIQANKVWFQNFPDELAPGMIIVNWRF